MMSPQRRSAIQRILSPACALILLSTLTLLSGCGNFFSCEGKSECPTGGGTGTDSGDYAYVANSATGTTYANGYTLTSGALTAATSSPYNLNYSPTSMVVTPNNSFLYASTDSALNAGVGYIYGYSIASTGALTILDSGTALASEDVSSIDVSPDGKWLFALDDNGLTLEEYSLNATTGIPTFAQTYGVTGATNGTITPASVKVAPSGDYVVVALGTGGAELFSFDTTTGVAAASTLISPATNAIGIYAVAADVNNYLYCVGTAGLQVFSVTTAGVATLVNTYPTGNGAHSIAINTAGTYLYVGNETDSTITAYQIGANAALTAVSGSPFAGPKDVNSLAIDTKQTYLLTSGQDASAGIQLFSIGTTGGLTLSGSAGTGTTATTPGAIAIQH